ncbi:ribonuclease T2 family protein [Parerythrobacter aestuarii]|uniref:ribonuclease T2 family protein n=1 Tax=Parerythrobacter aestuarii TaxID=3020909 RepID=UPI0024DE20B3|nr:ribonuclease T [Parerythrobacter aestuarii]
MRKIALFVGLAGLCAGPAFAQSYQCRVPQNLLVPEGKSGQPRQLPVTGYTFALSWSPEFCKNRQSSPRHRSQCSGRNGRFGMVVHGLWPDGRSTWPQYCRTAQRVSVPEAKRNMCMMPSARLMADQWRKHGACLTRKPETYFKVTRILWNSLKHPDYDRLSREDGLTAGRIRAAFTRANPDWTPEMVGVKLNERGWLQELRLCYGKDWMPTRCKRSQLGARDNVSAKIWRGL